MTSRPLNTEYAEYFAGYVALVPEPEILQVLEKQQEELRRLGGSVASARETFRYSPEKWSVRQVFGHLIDAERVFAYRAFCISRGESAPLPSFDENPYVANSRYDERPLRDILSELTDLRKANLQFWGWLTDKDWLREGTAGSNRVSVRALAFITAGHVRHHMNILRDRYDISLRS